MYDFSGKTIIISGGTSGIGAECAIRLSQLNADVVIIGKNESKGANVESVNPGKICFYKCDVTVDTEVQETVSKIVDKYGSIDILFNNAGVYPSFVPLPETKIEEWFSVYSSNVFGIVSLTKYCLPYLIKTNGILLNNASIAGLQNFASGQGYAYASSKSAVIQFTKMLAKQYAKNVRINCICPGVIDTPLYYNLNKAAMEERVPMKRIGTVQDVANVVIFLISDQSSYIHGAAIPIDGGLSL